MNVAVYFFAEVLLALYAEHHPDVRDIIRQEGKRVLLLPVYLLHRQTSSLCTVEPQRELCYYGYDDASLKPYLHIKSSKNYLHRLMLPAELDTIQYHKELYRHTVKYLKRNDPMIIFIYGENDPWSSSGVCTWLDFKKKRNMHLYVDPAGSHRARIATLPATQREECIALLKEWLDLQ